MGLKIYIAKRVLYMFVLIFFVLTINFIIFMLMPGDPIELFASGARLKSPEQVQEVLQKFGLDQPLQIRYVKYIQNMLTGQFGYSYFSGKQIIDEIGERLTNTLLLVGISTVLSILFGILLGVIAAHKRGKSSDNFMVVTSLITYSLPSFWLGMVLLLIFSTQLGWFPAAGASPRDWAFNPPANILAFLQGKLLHLFLPVLTLVIFQYGGYLLLTRATMVESLTEDYIVTAKAKGLKERQVLYKHALKNASLPLITNVAMSFGFMLSGAIITEQVFTYQGLGKWIWDAIAFTDYPALQAIFFIIALCVIIANFIADLLYGVIDPRIKYE